MTVKIISDHELVAAELAVNKDPKYGKEQELIEKIIKRHPLNDDLYWIAIKVSVIDLTNSTQLTNYKSKLSLYDISKIILELYVDSKIKNGDISIVSEIAKRCKKFEGNGVNVFSFASKYCCYHNVFAYNRDDFSIFDTVLSQNLYKFETIKNPLKKTTPEGWRVNMNYEAYNNYIGDLLDENNIHIDGRRRMFDHYVWDTYRPSKKAIK